MLCVTCYPALWPWETCPMHASSGFGCFPCSTNSTVPRIPRLWAGIFKKSMGARNRGGIGLSYRPARLHRLAEFSPWNQFRGLINIKKDGLCYDFCGVWHGEICLWLNCTQPTYTKKYSFLRITIGNKIENGLVGACIGIINPSFLQTLLNRIVTE